MRTSLAEKALSRMPKIALRVIVMLSATLWENRRGPFVAPCPPGGDATLRKGPLGRGTAALPATPGGRVRGAPAAPPAAWGAGGARCPAVA